MTTEPIFTTEFIQDLLKVLFSLAIAGVALWTWQRRYWEYQLRRQTDDWKDRQTYARLDSRRVSMEALLVDINRAVETFLTSMYLAASAIKRRKDAPADQQASWNAQTSAAVEAFNDAERAWLAEAQVLGGRLSLHYGGRAEPYEEPWQTFVTTTTAACTYLNSQSFENQATFVLEVRRVKQQLLTALQNEIDTFVLKQLETFGPARRRTT